MRNTNEKLDQEEYEEFPRPQGNKLGVLPKVLSVSCTAASHTRRCDRWAREMVRISPDILK